MTVTEDQAYSKDYLDPDKRSIANAAQVFFRDGSSTTKVVVEYPIGHRRRRAQGIPLLQQKASAAFSAHFGPAKSADLLRLFANRTELESMPVHEFASQWTK